jgi:hypothetical protein
MKRDFDGMATIDARMNFCYLGYLRVAVRGLKIEALLSSIGQAADTGGPSTTTRERELSVQRPMQALRSDSDMPANCHQQATCGCIIFGL